MALPFLRLIALLILVILASAARPAAAQNTPVILIQPWDASHPHQSESRDDFFLLAHGHDKDSPSDFQIFRYNSDGRIKFDAQDNAPRYQIAYKALMVELFSNHPALPGGMTDISVVGAAQFGDLTDGWQLSALAGAGYAVDNHFGDTDAIYGVGSIHLSHQINDHQALHLGLWHDGNRTLLPDVPLPYIAWTSTVSDTLAVTLGLPATLVAWTPTANFKIEFAWNFPTTVTARASQRLCDGLWLYSEFNRDVDAFNRHSPGDRRLFYEYNRVAGGVRWTVNSSFDLRVGVGYAFDQQLSTGFDMRDVTSVAQPSDEPLLFLLISSAF